MPKDPNASPIQRCPICGAAQPLSARTCGICGARLTGERVRVAAEEDGAPARPHFDPALGNDDLYVGDLTRRSRLALVGCLGLVLLLAIAIAAFALRSLRDENGAGGGAPLAEVEGIQTPRPTAPPTATLRPDPVTLIPTREMPKLPTVTPAPPTPTETPTPGPCLQTAGQGDTVLAMAYRCGHREMAVVDLILDMNGMRSANELQLGQTLEIPWPTPTPGPGGEPVQPEDETSAAGQGGDAVAQASANQFGTPNALATYQNAEPTLRPGQAWHTVRAGETILSIAFDYSTTLETLSQINPEVPFLQCDFGDPAGGPTCSVLIVEGQQIRVPVPLPTMTPTLTPEGTLTPTPTLSPTFNAPYLLSPDNNARFRSDDLVTLRWGGTGTLAPAERYLVRLRDLDTGEEHLATVPTTTYILPGGWQPDDRQRHTFEWTISVVELDGQYNIVREDRMTDARRFTWESR